MSTTRPWHSFYDAAVPPQIDVPPIRLQDFPRLAAKTAPNRTAIVYAGGEISYQQLVSLCNSFAFSLITSGIDGRPLLSQQSANPANPSPAETRPVVVLWLPNLPEFVIAYYGALSAGCIVSAASPALTTAELAAQLRDCQPAALVILPEQEPAAREALNLAGVKASLLIADQARLRLPEDFEPAGLEASAASEEVCRLEMDSKGGGVKAEVDLAREVAVLQYTSGTTGQAKGAAMSQRNLVANALQNAHWFGWHLEPEKIRTLCVLPLCHTWGMCCMMNSTMAVGGTLILVDQRGGFDPQALANRCAETRATVLYGSATMFHRLLEALGGGCLTHPTESASLRILSQRGQAERACERSADSGGSEWTRRAAGSDRAHQLSSLRHVKAGAMLTQGDLKARWDAVFPHAPLQQGYGLTEASPESHNNPVGSFRPGTVGVPIQSTDCRICDPTDPTKVLPPGEPGEVQLHGPQITLGYWRRPEATRAAFAPDGWLRTGDIGVMDQDGYLKIVDRIKDLIKFRGWSISPNAIEDCLLKHPGVGECVVVGRPDAKDGEVPTACIVPRGLARPQAPMDETVTELQTPAGLQESLQQHAATNLGPYERPREWRFVAAIPKNHVAKPLRRVLRDWVGRSDR